MSYQQEIQPKLISLTKPIDIGVCKWHHVRFDVIVCDNSSQAYKFLGEKLMLLQWCNLCYGSPAIPSQTRIIQYRHSDSYSDFNRGGDFCLFPRGNMEEFKTLPINDGPFQIRIEYNSPLGVTSDEVEAFMNLEWWLYLRYNDN